MKLAEKNNPDLLHACNMALYRLYQYIKREFECSWRTVQECPGINYLSFLDEGNKISQLIILIDLTDLSNVPVHDFNNHCITNLDLRGGFKHLNYRGLPEKYIESKSLEEFLIKYFEHNKEVFLKLGLQEINPGPIIDEIDPNEIIWHNTVGGQNILYSPQ